MSERRDGTGTGVWTHPAAEPEQPPDPLVCAQAMAELRASRNIIVGYWTKVVDEFSRMRVGLRKLAKAHRLLRGLYVLEQKATAHLCTANAQAISERDLLQQRVAELEAENERLRAALMPLETSSIACAVQEAAATMQRDQLQAALEAERRAVDKLAEHIEIACEGFSHGSMSAITVAPGGYTDAAEIAAWARNRAREESGE